MPDSKCSVMQHNVTFRGILLDIHCTSSTLQLNVYMILICSFFSAVNQLIINVVAGLVVMVFVLYIIAVLAYRNWNRYDTFRLYMICFFLSQNLTNSTEWYYFHCSWINPSGWDQCCGRRYPSQSFPKNFLKK